MRDHIVVTKFTSRAKECLVFITLAFTAIASMAQQPREAARAAGLDPALQSRVAREVPKWRSIPLDQLRVWKDAVQQLQEYGLEPDMSSASIVSGGTPSQWEYIVSVRPSARRASAARNIPPSDSAFRPARIVVISNDDPAEGFAPPIVAFEGGNLSLPAESTEATPSALRYWTSWRWHSTTCSTRIWCSKNANCGDTRCATYDVEYRNKIDNKGRVTKTDWRYKFKHCGC